MIYFVRKNGEELRWYNEEMKFPFGYKDIVEVYAYGEELNLIRKSFANLPDVPTSNDMTWRGKWAQFIYDNFKIIKE